MKNIFIRTRKSNSFYLFLFTDKNEYNKYMKYDINTHIQEYKKIFGWDISQQVFLESAKDIDFSYLTETSSVYSSNIEGNTLNVNSFMNAKLQKTASKEVQEIENLKKAYVFAQNNILDEKNFLEGHKILSESLLIKSKRGTYRQDAVWVFWSAGLIYMAVEAEHVSKYMWELFQEIEKLREQKMTFEEVLYYASFIHLRFVHIHPFSDGNGRSARILEKWFITQKLWKEFWKLQSEKYYWEHRAEYYSNINLGVNFYELDYSWAINFLSMLPKSLTNN